MSSSDVNLVIADINYDADWWDQISAAMQTALTAMDGALLPYATFDGVSHGLGATRTYEGVLTQMTTLLQGGVTETASIATRLRSTAEAILEADTP